MNMEHSVPQHIVKGTKYFQDSLPGSGLAHVKQVADVVQAGRHGQFKQADGQLGICREGWLQGDVLPLQVWQMLLQEIPKGGPGHPEGLQQPFIIPGLLDNTLPPVLSGPVCPEMVELETWEGDHCLGGGILESIFAVTDGVQPEHRWGRGDRFAVVALGLRAAGR